METLIDIWISSLNEMIIAVHEMTSESEIDKIYESVEEFLRHNKEEIENMYLQNLLKKLKKKITSYAKLQGPNRLRIIGKFLEFILMLKREYGACMECVKGSILLYVTFSSMRGADLYRKDLENGLIGKHIIELFSYQPFLDSLGLKADDLVISLNGKELTKQTGMADNQKHSLIIV